MKKSKNIVVKESLQISNIGPLKAVNIEQIKPFTVLIEVIRRVGKAVY